MRDRQQRHDVIWKIFKGTGPWYEEIVDVVSEGEDTFWKKELIGKLKNPRRVLDLASGTGILTFMIRDRFPSAHVTGVDINPEYLAYAQEKAKARGDAMVEFVVSPAEDAHLEGTFDSIVTCYLPKYTDLPKLIPYLVSKLEPGGQMIMHDFTWPTSRAPAYYMDRKFEHYLEWARTERPEAVGMFEELPGVIKRSTWVSDLARLYAQHGLEAIQVESYSFGTAAIVSGVKPSATS